jgi:hypothetical protein
MRTRTLLVALLGALLLLLPACEATTASSDDYSIEYKLAAINEDPSTEAEFGRILDQVQRGGSVCDPEPDRERAADVIVASWQQSGGQDSLIEWARAVASVCA